MNKTLKITILGCGASAGVPMVGCNCAVCTSTDSRNNRLRSSIYIEASGKRILVDSTPDLRIQALRAGIDQLDAIIYTHAHADHMHGIDDLRALMSDTGDGLPMYGTQDTFASIEQRFAYCLQKPESGKKYRWYRPILLPRLIEYYQPFTIGAISILPFLQLHGNVEVVGLRIGDFAYSTDVHTLPEAALQALAGVKLWIVDCLALHQTPTHSHLAQTLQWIETIKPARAVLTHLSHYLEYTELTKQLPPGVEVAYDGMELTI